jgi:hypothetical protein
MGRWSIVFIWRSVEVHCLVFQPFLVLDWSCATTPGPHTSVLLYYCTVLLKLLSVLYVMTACQKNDILETWQISSTKGSSVSQQQWRCCLHSSGILKGQLFVIIKNKDVIRNTTCYSDMLKPAFWSKCWGQLPQGVVLLHHISCPNTAVYTKDIPVAALLSPRTSTVQPWPFSIRLYFVWTPHKGIKRLSFCWWLWAEGVVHMWFAAWHNILCIFLWRQKSFHNAGSSGLESRMSVFKNDMCWS